MLLVKHPNEVESLRMQTTIFEMNFEFPVVICMSNRGDQLCLTYCCSTKKRPRLNLKQLTSSQERSKEYCTDNIRTKPIWWWWKQPSSKELSSFQSWFVPQNQDDQRHIHTVTSPKSVLVWIWNNSHLAKNAAKNIVQSISERNWSHDDENNHLPSNFRIFGRDRLIQIEANMFAFQTVGSPKMIQLLFWNDRHVA